MFAEFYVQYEYWFAAVQLVLAMLGMGATLTGRDFRDVVSEPRAVSLGTIIQIVIVPLSAYLFLRLLGIQDGVAVGLALIAAIPGGTVSNIFTFLARGNSALSISITALTTLACLVTTPLILSALITGIVINMRQVFALEPELRWIKMFRTGNIGISVRPCDNGKSTA